MTAVLARARAELRARRSSTLALTLLVGIAAGAVMTLAAGARRTETAYLRFGRAYKAADMLVYPALDPSLARLDFNPVSELPAGVAAQLDFDAVSKLPQVAAASIQRYMFVQERIAFSVYFAPQGNQINRFKVLDGRMPSAAVPNEAAVSYWTAKARRWRVGERVTINVGTREGTFFPLTLHIVGIEASPGEFPPQIGINKPSGGADRIHIRPITFERLRQKNPAFLDFLLLRFKRGARDNPSVNDALNQMARDPKTGQSLPQLNGDLNDQAVNVQRSIQLHARALWLVDGLAALIIVLVLSQLLSRQASIDGVENPTLAALGMTRQQIWLAAMGRALVVGVVGAGVGVVVAFAASPLMPIGTARVAEPNPGFSFDGMLLGLAALVVVTVLGLAAWPIWKNAGGPHRETTLVAGSSLAARIAATPALSPAVATGVRLAFESGHGRTEVPVRSSLLSVVLATVAFASALTFGAGLDHLLTTPRLYGLNWDVHLITNTDTTAAIQVLKPDPRVRAIANLISPPLILNDNMRFDILGLDQVKGRIEPVLVNGRPPESPTEVGLGLNTMRDADVKLGDTVNLRISAVAGSTNRSYKIVGVVVLPPTADAARLGSGAVITRQGVERMVPHGFPIPPPTELYFKFAPGVDKEAALADIMANPRIKDDYDSVAESQPTDLVNFGEVRNLPLLLAALVGLLAAATLAHTLVSSIRRKRRDLAILKMIGFVPRQIRWAIVWQATTFVATALVVGLPVGIVVGRAIWSAFATNAGTLPVPVTPFFSLLLTIPCTIAVANLIAAGPAVAAGRMLPAAALRAE